MIYTTQAVADMSSVHTGLVFWMITAIFIGILIYRYSFDTFGAIFGVFLIGMTLLVGTASFTEYHPKNVRVVATFDKFVPQLLITKCNKNSTCYTDKVYAQFIVNNEYVLIEVDGRVPMPKQVYLYGNDK